MIVNIRKQDTLNYKPFMECDDKEECARVMLYLYQKENYMFRVDEEETITFINKKEDIEYFLNRRRKVR